MFNNPLPDYNRKAGIIHLSKRAVIYATASNPFNSKDNFGSVSAILQEAAFPSRRNISYRLSKLTVRTQGTRFRAEILVIVNRSSDCPKSGRFVEITGFQY